MATKQFSVIVGVMAMIVTVFLLVTSCQGLALASGDQDAGASFIARESADLSSCLDLVDTNKEPGNLIHNNLDEKTEQKRMNKCSVCSVFHVRNAWFCIGSFFRMFGLKRVKLSVCSVSRIRYLTLDSMDSYSLNRLILP